MGMIPVDVSKSWRNLFATEYPEADKIYLDASLKEFGEVEDLIQMKLVDYIL